MMNVCVEKWTNASERGKPTDRETDRCEAVWGGGGGGIQGWSSWMEEGLMCDISPRVLGASSSFLCSVSRFSSPLAKGAPELPTDREKAPERKTDRGSRREGGSERERKRERREERSGAERHGWDQRVSLFSAKEERNGTTHSERTKREKRRGE